MIIDTLEKLGSEILHERSITSELDKSHHPCSGDKSWHQTQLTGYFEKCKEHGRSYTYEDYCKENNFEMCKKCSDVLNLIIQRKKVRRNISSLRGAITKYAVKLVEKNEATW